MENNLPVGSKPVVLVVEDDEFLSSVHKNKLTKEGFEVVMAGNGQEALDIVGKVKPGIILLDLIMPVMDGFETLKKLKEDPDLKDTKVIILTNLSQDEDKQRVMDLGAIDYIVKANVSFREIVNVVKHNLGLE
jgi:DNA-binding response OmpR family regulator